MSENPTVPEAIDHLESFVWGLPYVATHDTKCAIRVVLDELNNSMRETSLLRERLIETELKLNRAAGEIVVLREQAKEVHEAVMKIHLADATPYYPDKV